MVAPLLSRLRHSYVQVPSVLQEEVRNFSFRECVEGRKKNISGIVGRVEL